MRFEDMSVRQLRKLISDYRKYHNIKGYSRMKKVDLVGELNKRFAIQGDKLILKSETPRPAPAPAQEPTTQKRRIQPQLISSPVVPNKAFASPQEPSGRQPSKGQQRVLNTINRLERRYQNSSEDRAPGLAFDIRANR